MPEGKRSAQRASGERRPRSLLAAASLATLAGLFTARPALAIPEAWEIDPEHSAVWITARFLMVTRLRVQLPAVRGKVIIDEDAIEGSSVTASADAKQVTGGSAKRDKLLKGQDWLWTSRFPTVQFESTRVERSPDGKILVAGVLHLRDVKKAIILEIDGPTAAVNAGDGRLYRGATARTRLDRKHYGMTWNRSLARGGVTVSDEVDVEVDLTLVRAATATVSKR